MAKKERERDAFLMRLPPDLVERLDAEGVRWDRSRTWLIERAVRLWLKRLDASRARRTGKR